jgi:hypothetical protein
MNALVLLTFAVVMLVEFLATIGVLPRLAKFTPELCSMLVAVYVVTAGARRRFRDVRPVYWIVFAAVCVTMVCGAVANLLAPGPMISGLRYYLRAIPFFFLPAVFIFSEQDIRGQLRLLLLLAFVQVPLAVYQRMVIISERRFSGDDVFGTLMTSSILSIYLIGVVCVLTGLYLRGRLKTLWFGLAFLILLVPTMINETKGTLLLLPIGLMTVLLVGSPPGRRLRIIVGTTTLLTVFTAIYVPVFDYLRKDRPYSVGIIEFMQDPDRLERYLSKSEGLGAQAPAGRIDAIVEPLPLLARDPARLVFGLGIGNASPSSLGDQFVGAYNRLLGRYLVSSGSTFIMEIGFLGTALVFLLLWHIFRDSLVVAGRDPGLHGAIAIGWTGCTVIIAASVFYKELHLAESLSYLFWYWSGLVAAQRMRLAAGAPAIATPDRN